MKKGLHKDESLCPLSLEFVSAFGKIEEVDVCAELAHSSIDDDALLLLLFMDVTVDSDIKAGDDDCCEVSSIFKDAGPAEGGVEELDV